MRVSLRHWSRDCFCITWTRLPPLVCMAPTLLSGVSLGRADCRMGSLGLSPSEEQESGPFGKWWTGALPRERVWGMLGARTQCIVQPLRGRGGREGHGPPNTEGHAWRRLDNCMIQMGVPSPGSLVPPAVREARSPRSAQNHALRAAAWSQHTWTVNLVPFKGSFGDY